ASIIGVESRRFNLELSVLKRLLKEVTMIGSIALVLLGAAAGAATPCENLTSLKLTDTTTTSAVVVPEGPPPARGGGGGAARGGARGGDARGGVPQAQTGPRG